MELYRSRKLLVTQELTWELIIQVIKSIQHPEDSTLELSNLNPPLTSSTVFSPQPPCQSGTSALLDASHCTGESPRLLVSLGTPTLSPSRMFLFSILLNTSLCLSQTPLPTLGGLYPFLGLPAPKGRASALHPYTSLQQPLRATLFTPPSLPNSASSPALARIGSEEGTDIAEFHPPPRPLY